MSVEDELPSKIGTLVDYLRKKPEETVQLSDVASVTEILINTMQAYFRGVDTSIYTECRNLSDYITNARMEIASLQPSDLEEDRIPRAGMELDAIVQATETATNTIMESAETIMEGLGDDDISSKSDEMMAAVMNIFEACSFQDITGQRISKVVGTLQHIERRVADIGDLMGITEEHISAAKTRDIGDDDADPLLKGPALEGEGIDQSKVDEMLEDDQLGAPNEASSDQEVATEPNGDTDAGFDAPGGDSKPEAEEKADKKEDDDGTSQGDIDALFN